VILSVERLGGIRVGDDSKRTSLIDFIDKIAIRHTHTYPSQSHVLMKTSFIEHTPTDKARVL